MSKRKGDDTQPIAPARSLSTPSAGSGRSAKAPEGSSADSGQTRTQEVPRYAQPTQPVHRPTRADSDGAADSKGPASRGATPGRMAGGGAAAQQVTTQHAPAQSAASQDTSTQLTAPPSRAGATPATSTDRPPETREQQARSRPTARKARLRAVRVDPWSVMKMAFALSIALAVVTVVAVWAVWLVLSQAGVWDAINNAVSAVTQGDSNFDVTEFVSLERVLGVAMVVGAIDVVLITALATLGAFLYNLAAALLGGVDVTLAEDRR